MCESCTLFDTGSHPDFALIYKELLEYTKDGKGKAPPVQLPIDVIREFLIDKVSAKPTISDRKVYVISESEKLNIASQNALLKVLEEPPEYCCIILLCTHLEKLLPTIKSRCQLVRFQLIDEEKIVKRLESMGLDSKRSTYFARLGQGSLGLASQWAGLELDEAGLYKTKKKLIQSIAGYELKDALKLAGQFQESGRKITSAWAKGEQNTSTSDIKRRALKTVIRVVISALDDAMQMNLGNIKQMINFDQEQQIKRLSERFTAEESAEKIRDCYQTLRWIDAAVNEKLIFEHLLLNLAFSATM